MLVRFIVSLLILSSPGCVTTRNYAELNSAQSKLYDGVLVGEAMWVREAIARGANPQTRVTTDEEPLINLAAASGYLDVVKELRNAGMSLVDRNKYGQTPLMKAAFFGHPHVVRYLLDRGVSVDDRDQWGNTALLLSFSFAFGEGYLATRVSKNRFAVVQMLVKSRASIDHSNEEGASVLMTAATKQDPRSLDFILKQGAMPNVFDSRGETPLMYASRACLEENAELLIRYGARVGIRDNEGKTAIDRSAGCRVGKMKELLSDAFEKERSFRPDSQGKETVINPTKDL